MHACGTYIVDICLSPVHPLALFLTALHSPPCHFWCQRIYIAHTKHTLAVNWICFSFLLSVFFSQFVFFRVCFITSFHLLQSDDWTKRRANQASDECFYGIFASSPQNDRQEESQPEKFGSEQIPRLHMEVSCTKYFCNTEIIINIHLSSWIEMHFPSIFTSIWSKHEREKKKLSIWKITLSCTFQLKIMRKKKQTVHRV